MLLKCMNEEYKKTLNQYLALEFAIELIFLG